MSKYVDIPSIVQVIGSIYNNPSLLDAEDKYNFSEDDFTEEFHKIIFGSMYNLHALGAKEITLSSIEDYLAQRPKKFAIYQAHRGSEYILEISKNTQLAAFDYYYNRMKKMTLMRMYNEKVGLDLSWIYDVDNIMDTKKRQAQEDWLDNTSIEQIADLIDNKITEIRLKYVDDAQDSSVSAGDGALELLEELKNQPAVGYPMFGPIINSITRGARLGKFYLRSASQGLGKSRSMIADACFISCDEIYDSEQKKWVENGTKEPVLYIATEQQKDEIQTMMIAFLSDVDEDHILNGEYLFDEWERVVHAAEVLKKCPIYIQTMPDFSLKDIENAIKMAVREYEVKYLFFDYIFGSMKILSEVSSKAKVSNLREDNILFMISTRIKDLCNEYGIFVLSASQLSGDFKNAKILDQSYLRGAKSLSDKIDIGMIMVNVTTDDLEALQPILGPNGFERPAIKISIYKNRRGKYTNILLWCRDRRGVCKIEPMFVTNYSYELIEIEDLKIKIKQPEESAF